MAIVDQGDNTSQSRLVFVDMDGANSKVLVTVKRRRMLDVTIDFVTDIIYWSEMNENEARIEMMLIDGSSRKVCFLFVFLWNATLRYQCFKNPTDIS